MNLLILGNAKYQTTYFGTDRWEPAYVEGLSENDSVNQAFLWYIHNRENDSIVHDLAKAQELVQLYSQLNPPQYFEIVEVTKEKQTPATHSEFLGFDLAANTYSLLGEGLEIAGGISKTLQTDDKIRIIYLLLQLARLYFQPKLNSNGLFDDYQTANFCLECLMALQIIRPGLWENEDFVFGVVGLWRVTAKP